MKPLTSSTGDGAEQRGSRRDRGVTLLELLVVVTILGLVAVSLPPILGDRSASREAVARDIVASLRAARADAITERRAVAVSFDLEERRFGRPGSEVRLPERFELTLTAAAEAQLDDRRPGVLFFPDGSTTGGVVRLSEQGDGGMPPIRIDVRWLTGAVRRDG